MPCARRRAFPWLRIDAKRIYAIGDSMGAQEALLLAARTISRASRRSTR